MRGGRDLGWVGGAAAQLVTVDGGKILGSYAVLFCSRKSTLQT